jgi:hypothetical protein
LFLVYGKIKYRVCKAAFRETWVAFNSMTFASDSKYLPTPPSLVRHYIAYSVKISSLNNPKIINQKYQTREEHTSPSEPFSLFTPYCIGQ